MSIGKYIKKIEEIDTFFKQFFSELLKIDFDSELKITEIEGTEVYKYEYTPSTKSNTIFLGEKKSFKYSEKKSFKYSEKKSFTYSVYFFDTLKELLPITISTKVRFGGISENIELTKSFDVEDTEKSLIFIKLMLEQYFVNFNGGKGIC